MKLTKTKGRIEIGGGSISIRNEEFHETCHSVTFYFMIKDSKRCDITMPESIHTKDESKRSSAFAFIFGVN